jgi:hypothetical protein
MSVNVHRELHCKASGIARALPWHFRVKTDVRRVCDELPEIQPVLFSKAANIKPSTCAK